MCVCAMCTIVYIEITTNNKTLTFFFLKLKFHKISFQRTHNNSELLFTFSRNTQSWTMRRETFASVQVCAIPVVITSDAQSCCIISCRSPVFSPFFFDDDGPIYYKMRTHIFGCSLLCAVPRDRNGSDRRRVYVSGRQKVLPGAPSVRPLLLQTLMNFRDSAHALAHPNI